MEIKDQISKLQVEICINDRYREGMLSSVQCGVQSLPAEAGACMLFLGDQPQIPSEVSSLLIDEWKKSMKGILIPVTRGRKGHPVLISSKYFLEIDKLDPGQGLRQLMAIHEKDVGYVECNRDEILRDIDTPDDYRKEINRET
jgi:molybdenum cofactor cytidylyltransferase